MNRHIIGVDPGKKGFITTIDGESGEINHISIPCIGSEFDFSGLSKIVLGISERYLPQDSIVVIEDVHALPRSAAGATFTFGGIVYAIRMAFTMLEFPVVLVTPKKWQKEMYEGIPVNEDKKVMSVMAARRLFPKQSLLKTPSCKKPDNNLTDSLLIAEYGRRHYR